MNVGECNLDDNPRFNATISKLTYLQHYTPAAQRTFLHTFEGCYYDLGEQLTTDIASCIETRGEGETLEHIAKNTQGSLCLQLCGKAKSTCLIQMCCPLQSLNTFIPANIPVGFRILLANGAS